MKFYCYNKCSTCKKALDHIKNIGIDLEVRDIVLNKLSIDEIKNIYNIAKVDIKKLFNTSGRLYKEYNLKEKLSSMSLEEKIELLSTNGLLLKRPILIFDNKVIIGYDKEKYNNLGE